MENDTPQNPGGIAGKPLQPTVNSTGNTYEALEAHNTIPDEPKPDNHEAVAALHKEGSIKNIRTYESDIADLLKNKSGSVTKIAIAEQERMAQRARAIEINKKPIKESLIVKPIQSPELEEHELNIKKEKHIPFTPDMLKKVPVIEHDPGQNLEPKKIDTAALAEMIRKRQSLDKPEPGLEIEKPIVEQRIAPKVAPKPIPRPTPKPLPRSISNNTGMGEGKKVTLAVIISGVLVVGGITAMAMFFLYFKKPKSITPPITIEPSKIVTAENTIDAVVSASQGPMDILVNKKASVSGTNNTFVRINFFEEVTADGKTIKKPVEAEAFAQLLKTNMGPRFVRALNPSYSVGFHIYNSETYPVFIFKVDSYENAYAGMLSWEETMLKDLAPLLPKNIVATTTVKKVTASAATSTPFRDQVIKNKDTRVGRDASGKSVLYYSFPDKETLIITTNEATLVELFARLNNAKFVR
jgi:hypothetical protein